VGKFHPQISTIFYLHSTIKWWNNSTIKVKKSTIQNGGKKLFIDGKN